MRKNGMDLICPICTKSFYASKWDIESGRKYCSRECYLKAHRSKRVKKVINYPPHIIQKLGPGLFKVKCVKCGKVFTHKQYNWKIIPNQCKECSIKPCGVCGKPIFKNKFYCSSKCAHKDSKNNPNVIAGRKKQGQKIRGDNNPSKRPEVREKISLRLRENWKDAHKFQAKHDDGLGNMLRSTLELKLAKLLQRFNIKYKYEERLDLLDGKWVLPDFTIRPFGKKELIEVTGSAFRQWRIDFISKMKKIKQSYPKLPIMIVTYNDPLIYTDLLKLKDEFSDIDIFVLGPPKDRNKLVSVGIDEVFDFDYGHFLQWHDGPCSQVHQHSSKLVDIECLGYVARKKFVVDFGILKKAVRDVIVQIDHKLVVKREFVTESDDIYVIINFETKRGEHVLKLPKDEVFVIDDYPTIENLTKLFASEILDKLPGNVEALKLTAYEGLKNRCTIVYVRPGSPIKSEEGFLRAILFHGFFDMLDYSNYGKAHIRL